MDKYFPTVLPALLLSASCASAEPVKWLEDGSDMHATAPEVTSQKRLDGTDGDTQTAKPTVTLATGQEVVLTGGVYVKADDTSVVLAWAVTNDYIALEHPYISGAIDVQTTAEESITVANMIAELAGVTTAAPKYRKPVVPK